MIPQPFEARMMQYGYQQIRSDAQAAQLIRRELKGLRAEQQRRFPVWGCDFDWLLRIKVGAWYRLVTLPPVKRKRLIVIDNTR